MTDPIKLIVHEEPVKRVTLTPGKGRRPSVAVVYATREGDLEVLDGGKPMRWSDQMLTKYRTRYEVDISDHHLSLEFKDDTPLPTQSDVYHFHATVSASFRVTEPAETIRRNVTDAVPLVHGHLLSICRPITRQYSIEEAEEAEAGIHARFRRDTLIQGGITLYAVEVRLSLDEAGRKYLQDIEQARRDDKVRSAQHDTNVNDVARNEHIKQLQQAGDHLLQERERLAMGNRPLDVQGMIQLHLQRHPNDTEGAMKLLLDFEQKRLEYQEQRDDRWQSILATMAANGMAQPADVAPLLDAAVRHLEGSAGVVRAESTVQQPERPAPKPPAAIGWLDRPAAPPQPGPASGPANLAPVYLVLDESADARPWADALTDAAQDLFAAVAARPDVSAALRLSVVGFAERVAVRVPISRVDAEPEVPPLLHRQTADHAALFRWLLDHVPAEHSALKAEHTSVRPPLLILLSAGAPAGDWADPRQRLDRALRRSDVIAFGLGGAVETIAGFASEADLAFVPDAGIDDETAVRQFGEFLKRHVLACGEAARLGSETPSPAPPRGFRPA
ncbi:hypothetical protein ACFFX1_11670 [Dactylosporangium sucinum]|uniref:VWFA domain-containing protein n=1 Tax=Dactylosporangium sucinum TaxID=1424081 RepID=A0A917TM70_9ACTN|nr:hypothetical protein [Dactylosporangium sucinum]GGM27937.1 hypothetical protein GCM10007977_031580 [Dactylosporangium sucinum]